MKITKETVKRAARTFLQTFLGYVVVNITLVDTSAIEAFKSGLMGLLIAATAAGIAAIMNLEPADEKGGK